MKKQLNKTLKSVKSFFIYDLKFFKISDFYYNIKWTIINFCKYRKIVSQMRTWDSFYILLK